MLKSKRIMIGIGVLASLLYMASCQKNTSEITQSVFSSDRVVEISTGEKTSSTYWLNTQIGHDGKNCPGCVLFMGKMIHRDCMRHGRYCRLVAQVELDTIMGTATTVDTLDLTSEIFFAMPDRSLYFYTDVNNDRIYLNIPEQLVFRDSVTRQFTFTGLSFTVGPVYSNN